MRVYHLESARKEFYEFDFKIRSKFEELFTRLKNGELLARSKFKKLRNQELYEFRVKHKGNIFRAIAGEISQGFLIVLFFQKKYQETPKRFLEIAKRRLNNYLK